MWTRNYKIVLFEPFDKFWEENIFGMLQSKFKNPSDAKFPIS